MSGCGVLKDEQEFVNIYDNEGTARQVQSHTPVMLAFRKLRQKD